MGKIRTYVLTGLNLKVNPLLLKDGEMIRCINMENDFIGAKKKRPGYTTYLGTANGSVVDSLFNFQLNNGTQFWNYRASGGVIQYSQQGTGDWSIAGGGTMTNGTPVYTGITENTMLAADGVGSTRHTANGTSFTDTTGAPISYGLQEYQNRMYAIGTASTLFWSNAGTPTDWTNDSSSINIPGAGRLNSIFKSSDRLITSKNSGLMHRWDGFRLVDLATKLGPSSSQSIGETEDFRFYLNRLGVFEYGGDRPSLRSNPIERQIYNDEGEGIAGTVFDTAPGICHRYDYFVSVGSVTDNLTDETVSNCILKYDFQQNEWNNYSFADRPTSWLSYKDRDGDQQLIFSAGSQCYTFGGTQTTDNGASIEAVMEFVVHADAPESEKKFNYLWASANPGCEAHVQIAIADTFTKGKKTWVDAGQLTDGFLEYHFPQNSRGRLLFIKVTEASRNARFAFYGYSVDFDVIDRR